MTPEQKAIVKKYRLKVNTLISHATSGRITTSQLEDRLKQEAIMLCNSLFVLRLRGF